MTSRRGKTVGWDKASGGYKRLSTEDYAFGAEGVLVSSYRVASLSALGSGEHLSPTARGTSHQ